MRLAMSTPSKSIICSREDDYELRRGPWSVEEDDLLISYIANNGEGRWNLLAIRSGNPRKTKKENENFLVADTIFGIFYANSYYLRFIF